MTRFRLDAATVLVAAMLFYGCSGADDSGNGGDGGSAGAGGSGGTAATGGGGGSGGTAASGGDGGSGGTDLCAGVDCTSDNECVANGTCDPADGSCIPGDNEPADALCDLLGSGDGVCDGDGTCVEPPPECVVDDDCEYEQTCDDDTCVGPKIAFREDFESGLGAWTAETGIWQVGTPTTVGPDGCNSGTQCAGTVLDENYPSETDSRFISPTIELPTVSGTEELRLRFFNWFSYQPFNPDGDFGQVQVSVRASDGTFGDWMDVGTAVSQASPAWSAKDVDLSAYAGEVVRLAFFHNSDNGNRAGWYIDDVEIVAKAPMFTGDFESGWADWGADRGVWQVGTPTTVGPDGCNSGTQCAGTVLDENYPSETDSRFISPTIELPTVSGTEELRLRFFNWFSYQPFNPDGDFGQVQVSVRASDGTFGDWMDVGTAVSEASPAWSAKDVDLSAYAGEVVRLAFFHNSDNGNRAGWYIDDVQILTF